MQKLIGQRPVFRVSPGTQLFISLATIFVCFVVFMLGGIVFAAILFDMDVMSLSNSSLLYSRENLGLIKFLQIVQSIGLFIVPPLLIAWLLSTSVFGYLKMNTRLDKRLVLITALAMFTAIPVINFFAEVNSWLSFPEGLKGLEQWMKTKEEDAMELTRMFLQADNLQTLALNVFMIGMLPALGEELLFRGILQKQFTLWFKNHHLGILVSAVLFSALHLQFYGFLPRTLLGMMFGYMLVWSGSLWMPIIGHFVNNTTIVLITYFTGMDMLDHSIEEVGAPDAGIGYFFMGILLFIPLMWLFYKQSKTRAGIKSLSEEYE